MSRINTGRPIYQKGAKPENVAAIRNDAHNRDCTLKICGVCSHDPSKSVGCHMRFFGLAGAAQKPDDIFILDACSDCHAILDRRDQWEPHGLTWEHVLLAFMTTLANRRASGLIHLGMR